MFHLLIIIVILLWWLGNRSDDGPPILSKRLPIIGHVLIFLTNTGTFEALKWTAEQSEKLGGVVRMYFGTVMLYVVTDPVDALTISNKCLYKSFLYRLGQPLLKNGLITVDGHSWHKHRKLLNPAFTPHILHTLLDIFNDQAKRLVAEFSKEEGKLFDQENVIQRNNLETICGQQFRFCTRIFFRALERITRRRTRISEHSRSCYRNCWPKADEITTTSFGANPEEFKELQRLYLPNLKKSLNILSTRIRKPWLVPDHLYKWTALKKEQDEYLEVLGKLSESIIQSKMEALKHSENTGIETDQLNPFLRTILKVNREGHFSASQTRAEIDTIIVAGHETTATTLTFALTVLGSYPEVQEKAYQEVLQVMGDSEYIDKDDLAKLTYVEAVLKETLRLYPIVSHIARSTDDELKLRNYTLKARKTVIISIYGILRDKIWGPDRYEFRPERWLDKDSVPDHKYYAAFGLGRRFCIGRTYSYISMKVTLAHVLRHYKITSNIKEMVVQFTVLTKPLSGHQIILEKRKKE